MTIRTCFLLPLPLLLALACPAMGQAAPQPKNFALCHDRGGPDCVVDGDTFWIGDMKVRIADIDTPETHGPRCREEEKLGLRATRRLRALLNAGAFSLEPVERDRDRYGRALRRVTRNGQSIGALLVSEGLARPWTGARQPWCRS